MGSCWPNGIGIRNVSATYVRNDGTFVPGYLPGTKLLGLSSLSGNPAPEFAEAARPYRVTYRRFTRD